MMELRQAKETLEGNGYERKLVYKVSYLKDGKRFYAFFENSDDAQAFIGWMESWNEKADDKIYKYIVLNKWSWEVFIEP